MQADRSGCSFVVFLAASLCFSPFLSLPSFLPFLFVLRPSLSPCQGRPSLPLHRIPLFGCEADLHIPFLLPPLQSLQSSPSTIMTCLFRRSLICSVQPLSLLLLISLSISPSALAVSPLVVTRPQYATANQTLYVQGGSPDAANPITSFYSLSLSIPWNDTAPPWVALPDNTSGTLAPSLWKRTLSLSADKTQLLIWDLTSSPSIAFNLSGMSWMYKVMPLFASVVDFGQTAVIDPKSAGLGTFYVPNGCPEVIPAGSTPKWTMCKFDMSILNDNVTNVPMPTLYDPIPNKVLFYSFVYSTVRSTFILYGGIGDNRAANPNLFEYNTTSSAWAILVRYHSYESGVATEGISTSLAQLTDSFSFYFFLVLFDNRCHPTTRNKESTRRFPRRHQFPLHGAE